MKWLMVILVVLVILQALGTGVFAVRLITRTDWRTSRMGRHLALYAIMLFTLYAVAFISALPSLKTNVAFFSVVLVVHGSFAILVWQRVYMLEMSLRRENGEEHVQHDNSASTGGT